MNSPRTRAAPISVRDALILALVVFLLALLANWLFNREGHTREQQVHQMTVYALINLQASLTQYKIIHHSLPGPTLRDAMESLEKDGMKYYRSFSHDMIKPGCDAWGRALMYELRDADHAIIRSVGANGVDEKGGGDDIQLDVPFPLTVR